MSMQRAGQALFEYMTAHLAERRACPQDDLVSDMTALQAAGAPLTDAEVITNLSALLVAGNLTTTDLIGNAVRIFLTNPDELGKLKADPSLVTAAVEETLRFEPPVDITGRIASREMEVGGCPIHATQSMSLSLRAANRDRSSAVISGSRNSTSPVCSSAADNSRRACTACVRRSSIGASSRKA